MDDFDLLDHYSVLGVDRDATPGEIDRAYREALLREHPDRSNHPHANERASRVNEAGRVLLDPNRRRQYDPEADTRERSARAGLRHLPVAAEEDNGSSQGRSDPQSRAGRDADEERYAQVAHNPRQQRGIDKPAARSSRVRRTFIAGTAAIAALIVTAALIYQFILRTEFTGSDQSTGAINQTTISSVSDDQTAVSADDQRIQPVDANGTGQQTEPAAQVVESDSASQLAGSVDSPAAEDEPPPVPDRSLSWDAPPAFALEDGVDYHATIEMVGGGTIEIDLYEDLAPGHVNNFVFLARQGFYNAVTFHRIIYGFMAQGGDPTGFGTGGPGYLLDAEFNDTRHLRGIVSMARSADPNSAGSQFFIVYDDAPQLDGQYTAFGEVTSGMDVVSAFPERDPADPSEPPGPQIATITISEIDCQANPDDEDCRDDGEMQEEDGQSSDSGNGLSRQAATSGAQFAGKHGGPLNLEMGRSMPKLDASLTDREREIQLGPWFYRQLFQFSDEIVRHDGRLGLIGYNYYSSNYPSSVCRDSNGEPFSHGWDAQPYEATPAGRQDVLDWQTRSWHEVYSVLHGEVVFVDAYSGTLGIFDGKNTVYYKHLNEIGGNFGGMNSDDGTTGGDQVFPGDYIGRMGMRGTALAPHLTLEVRAGLPPHDRCPSEGSATSPIPYLYRLLGGR